MPRFEFEFFRITKECPEGETVYHHLAEFGGWDAAKKYGEGKIGESGELLDGFRLYDADGSPLSTVMTRYRGSAGA